jgi:hypothetical protein
MVRSCFDAPEVEYTYTSAEVVTQLQAGVRVKLGLGSMKASGELVKKVKFGTPVHATLERLAMQPTEACSAMLRKVPFAQIEQMYAVQEVLTAEIAEQTCGRLDASGRFVGVGSGEGEFTAACMQESLEPVAVAYRIVPMVELFDAANLVVAPPQIPTDCPWGELQSVSSTMTSLAINGEVMDVRGTEMRATLADTMYRCGYPEAAAEFLAWRARRRVTNVACATLVGCYPFGIGFVSGMQAKNRRYKMEDHLRP